MLSLLSLLLLPLLTITALPSAHPKLSLPWSSTRHLITFGDSYTYIQGTHGHQNYSFIGDAQNYSYTPSDLLSNRIIQNQTSTASGGPVWTEYLTSCGVKEGLTNPRSCGKELWDFAFAGADVSEEFLALHHNFTISLVRQVEQFITYGEPVLSKIIDKKRTLVAFWIGINDINDSAKFTNVSFPNFYDEIIGTLFESVQEVHGLGYRDFLFMNLPPLDRTPGNVVRAGGPLPNGTMIGWWDGSLQRHAEEFGKERDVSVRVFDVNGFLNGVMDEHEKWGLRNVTGYCASYDQPYINTEPEKYGCLPLDEYFWFNTGHMTSHVHKILAGAVEQFLNQ